MQSEIVALLETEGSLRATMLVRRSCGQFAFERIDARVAAAARGAARWEASNHGHTTAGGEPSKQ